MLLDKNGIHLLSKGDRNVTNDIESILEMDSKSFLNAIYIRQGEITNLIEKTAAERKELITKLLNIDSLEVAWDEIKNIINIYETQKNVNEGKITERLGTLETTTVKELSSFQIDIMKTMNDNFNGLNDRIEKKLTQIND